MTNRSVVTITSLDDRERVARWAHQTGIGTVVEFRKKTRSVEQNAKMHAMLGEVAAQVIWFGKRLKVEDWKNMFTASLRKAQVVPGIDPGTVVPLGIHTSTMTVDEMANMIELIYAFGADPEHLVTFKDPHPGESSSLAGTDEPSLDSSQEPDPAAAGEGYNEASAVDPSPSTTSAAGASSKFNFSFSAEELPLLVEFARKALDAAAEGMAEVREDKIDRMLLNYRDALRGKDSNLALDAMQIPIAAVVRRKRTRSEAANYIARDILCVEAEELEGRR